MGRLRNALRATLCTDPDASRAISVADHVMRLDSRDEFSTALVAIVDPVHQTMSCASAGHPGPLIWEIDGTVSDPFYERGLPLGVRAMDRTIRTAQVVTLKPGCFAAFFTDGLLEWNRDILGAWTALCDAVKRRDIREAEHPAKALRDAVIHEANHRDDIAILTVRMDELVRPEA
jgi:serine phosphatase RsbU (regulator of sigma subunit)